jgi:1-acyl-sn-glycerol-3-phosphate acyltransferase
VRKVRDITYPPVVAAARLGFKALGLKISINGAHHIPESGGAVLAINHISYVDFIFSGFAARPSGRLVRFMAKRELFDHRLTGPLMRSLHHINVDREDGMDSYQTALRYLADGEVVGLFPEATISRSFELKDFKSGTVRMAQEAGVPLIPVIVWGTQRIYTKDHPRDLSRGKAITISVGAAVPLTGTAVKDTETLRADMTSILDKAISTYPQHEDGAWWVPQSYGGTAPSREEAMTIERAEARERAEKRRAERQAERAAEAEHEDPTSGTS